MVRFILALLAIFVFSLTARAAITISPWVPVYQGIEYATGLADTNEVRLQRAFAMRVDLQDPAIEMFSTPAGGPLETIGQTTTTFVNTYGVKVGVNANFFSPVTTTPNDPRNLSGLALSQGQIVSPVESTRPMVLVTSNNVASIVSGSFAFNPTNYWTGVAGSDRVLINGVVQTFAETDFTIGNHPRTAVGISQNGRYLVMLVIDGRQPTWSVGAPLTDVAQWLVRFGCYQGLNLDGGGSTTMVKAQNGGTTIVNKPSGGIQRVNGNHLGAFSQEIAPVFVNPPQNTAVLVGESATFSPLIGGTTPLRYQWQKNGNNISGATNSTFTISSTVLGNTGTYTLVVSNHVGVASASASLNVNYHLATNTTLGGVIAKSPNTPNHPPNSTVDLTAVPDPGFVFTGWSGDVESTNNPVSLTMTGHKSVTAMFSGSPPDIIMDNPAATYVGSWTVGTTASGRYGANYHFAATSSSNATATATYRPNIATPGKYNIYIWYPQGGNRSSNAPWQIVSENDTRLIAVDQRTDGGSWKLISTAQHFARGTNGFVRLSNNANNSVVIADAVRWSFVSPPQIVSGPTNQSIFVGGDALFSVTVTGSEPLNYQWYFNQSPIPAATGATFHLNSAEFSDSGQYSVSVSNAAGAATSAPATLTVIPSPIRFEAITILTNGLTLGLSSETTLSFAIERSTNFVDWTLLTSFTNRSGSVEFTDSSAPAENRFYRARIFD